MKNKEFKSLFMLMINMFVVMMGIGLVIPILPYYVEAFGASSFELGLLIAVFSFMQFLLAPFWGRMSDKFGRKPLIAIGMFGFAGAEFIFAFATELWMLFLSRILAGSFGSAVMPSAMAYVSDRTSSEKRGHGMGMLGAAMALGIVVGPGIGGWLAEVSLSLPFLFAGIAATLAGIFSLFLLPESLSKEKRMELEDSADRSNQFSQMWHALKSPVGFLLILVFGLSFGLANFQTIFGMYALHQFDYSPSQVGFIMVVVGVIGAVAQGGLVGRLTVRFGDERVVLGALLLSGIGFVIMMLAFDFVTVIFTTCLFFLGNSILRPSVNTMISKLAGDRQGMIMGLNNSFLSLGNVAGALLAGLMFEWNMYLPYSIGALTMFVGFFATVSWLSRRKETIKTTA
ncbi:MULTISPECIES: MFS transporter [Alkalihalophilus]|uniref:Multidrug-efflux transporter, NorA type n=1 Tax=Alkalihalophilus pseudofirmus (strain ATCC BAA-2126 / JCM 17055 / OF4) TaxID=398511 RepID=D3FVD8_ALKPO|nr:MULTISPECIES: tetracycline resistance MFS efflux pump [Alkalihalophilus]ADC50339.1 multidrug-efflux transporter, NorA type [Alkalihalophilus pseudofirmus OF4]MEC2072061.1 tetracycline resistance MFS efflux pump [Alkalihalophilus marmarensis]